LKIPAPMTAGSICTTQRSSAELTRGRFGSVSPDSNETQSCVIRTNAERQTRRRTATVVGASFC
jgi:hypothetical protein